MRRVLLMIATTLLAVMSPAGAGAAPGDLHLASITADGVKGEWSVLPSLSGDGSRVAFVTSSRLHPDDTDDHPDIYVKDVATGELQLASRAANGDKSQGRSFHPAISADGRRVAFVSGAGNLDPAGQTGVFVKDLASGSVLRAGPAGEQLVLSADGSKVAFETLATGLDPRDTDEAPDVYVVDIETGSVTLASTSTDGVKANGDFFHGSRAASLSADGSMVAFASGATNLHPDDTDDHVDVFVKNLVTGELRLVSTAADGTKATASSFAPSLSADGSILAFRSYASNLVPDFSGGFGQIFVKDLTTGAIQPASLSATGERADRGAADPSLSADGTRVAFNSSSTNLHPAATDLLSDVYVKDLTSGAVHLASVSAAGHKGNNTSYQVSLAADGSAVAFRSDASNLHPADPDSVPDVYIKELGGSDPSPDGAADLSIRQTDTPDPVPAGQAVTYDIEVTNNGPATATGVTVLDEVLAGMTVEAATTSQGDGCALEGLLVRCHLGSLPAGATASATVIASADDLGTLTNTVSVHANEPDPNALDNRSTISTRVTSAADMSVSISDTPDPVAVRSPLTYTIAVANHGPWWGSANVVTTLPPELTAVSVSVDGAFTSHCDTQRHEVDCRISLPDDDAATVRITASARKPGTYTATVTATPNDFDADLTNNTASETTTVTRR